MTVAELFARIGIKADDSQVKRFMGSMKVAKIGMIALSAAAAGTALAIKKITTEAMASAVALKQFEVETGSSAQELQKWQSVAEQTNQSAESVSNAIKAIVANQEKIKLGQGDISGFQMLGIDPRQDPFKILEDLRVKTKGLSEGMKKNILAQTGVGVGLLQTLNLTRKEFDAMSAKAFIISPQAIETLNKTKASIDLASRGIKFMKAQIAVGLSPQIEKLTKSFIEFMKVNEKGIIEGFKKAFTFVTKFTGAVMSVGRALNNVIINTIGWKNAVFALVGVFVLLNSTLLLSPIGLITAGIILLVAVMDDLFRFSQGRESLFGKMMEGIKNSKIMEWIIGFTEKIKDLFVTITETFGKIREFMSDVGANIQIGTEAQAAAGFAGAPAAGLAGMTNIKADIKINVQGDNGLTTAQQMEAAVKAGMQGVLNSTSAQMGFDE